MKRIRLRALSAAGIVAGGFCLMAAFYAITLNDKDAAERDFIQYWVAGQQLVHRANPYDPAATLRLERACGLDESQSPRVSFSPPVALFLTLPLGLASAKTGLLLWLLLLLACLSVALFLLWKIHGKPEGRLHLLGYVFAPALCCLGGGQLGIFFLLAIALFLYLHKSRPFLAGAALLPCAMKPHLFLPFAAVLLLWVVTRKVYGLLAGFSAALLASCALTLSLDRQVWSQYSQTMQATGVLNVWVPSLSATLRYLIAPKALWLQFLPEAAACLWAVWYFLSRRNRWSWMEQGMILLLVSAICVPYGFFFDETMLFPAVLFGLYRALDSHRSILPLALIGGVSLIEVLASAPVVSPYYLWTTPAWLAWYLYATRSTGRHPRGYTGVAED